MRMLAHNGEINTLLGNVNWQRALDQQRGRRDPLCSLDRSDSANLDAVFEHLRRNTARSKRPLGGGSARLLHLLRVRLAALGSSALPGCGPATASGAPSQPPPKSPTSLPLTF